MRRLALLLGPAAALAVVLWAAPAQPPGGSRKAIQLNVMCEHSVLPPDDKAARKAFIDKARKVFEEASKAIQDDNGSGDVPVNVKFELTGVGSFEGVSSILNQSDFDAVNTLGGGSMADFNIKVVKSINWCGGWMPAAVACALTPTQGRTSIVIEEAFFGPDPSRDGPIVAHEYGHNRNLKHRSGNNLIFLMNAGVNAGSRVINGTEAAGFLLPEAAVVSAATEDPMAAHAHHAAARAGRQVKVTRRPVLTEASAEDKKSPLAEFVDADYPHGVPYGYVVENYTKEEAAKLLPLLRDAKKARIWKNIVEVISYVGLDSEEAVKELMTFVVKPPPEGIDATLVEGARATALTSMGVLVNKTDNQAALKFLQAFVQPPKDGGPLVSVAKHSKESLVVLVLSAGWGLALSGKEQAGMSLNSLKQATATHASAAKESLNGMLETNAKIKAGGEAALREYFEKLQHRH
jgi:hypothetical protein